MINQHKPVRRNQHRYLTRVGTAALAVLCSLGSIASAQITPPNPPNVVAGSTAVMLDGRVLTQKNPLSIFATEGPIWNLDLENQGIHVTGKKITIPATVNGTPLLISGSSVGGNDGEAATGIGASSFERLADTHAIGFDRNYAVLSTKLGPHRLGATRSIFSTTEARRTKVSDPSLLRDPVAQAVIEQGAEAIAEVAHLPGGQQLQLAVDGFLLASDLDAEFAGAASGKEAGKTVDADGCAAAEFGEECVIFVIAFTGQVFQLFLCALDAVEQFLRLVEAQVFGPVDGIEQVLQRA